jgi:threonine/homoserine/homoserine lactone efflux protein
MGDAIGQVLPFAVGVAISPMPIVAVVLMLVSARAKANGLAFILGWVVAIAVLGGIVLAVAGPAAMTDDDGSASTGSSTLKLVLGLVLVVVAMRQWRSRPHGDEEPAVPKWMGAIDGFTPVKAAGAGVVLAAVNPKNLVLVVGGAAAIAQTEVSGAEQVLALVLFVLIATIGVAVPVVIYFAMGPRAPEVLQRLKSWMSSHNAAIMAVLCLVIGANLIGDSISGFSA